MKSRRKAVQDGSGDDGVAYLGLGAHVTGSVDPDVLSLNLASLVKGHVLAELFVVGTISTEKFSRDKESESEGGFVERERTFSVLETLT